MKGLYEDMLNFCARQGKKLKIRSRMDDNNEEIEAECVEKDKMEVYKN